MMLTTLAMTLVNQATVTLKAHGIDTTGGDTTATDMSV